jgi:8-oxo-dGTP pyrophosphatase MutT (NUDIX family)
MNRSRRFEIAGDYRLKGAGRTAAPGNLRSGFPVRGSGGSILDDVEAQLDNKKQREDSMTKASVAYVPREGKVLAVASIHDPNDVNMPGGVVKSGETMQDACVRELWEETGIRATALFPIFTKDYGGKFVTAFKVTSYTGNLSPSEEGDPKWEDPEALRVSRHGDYFDEMLKSLTGEDLNMQDKKD